MSWAEEKTLEEYIRSLSVGHLNDFQKAVLSSFSDLKNASEAAVNNSSGSIKNSVSMNINGQSIPFVIPAFTGVKSGRILRYAEETIYGSGILYVANDASAIRLTIDDVYLGQFGTSGEIHEVATCGPIFFNRSFHIKNANSLYQSNGIDYMCMFF